ncbi:MAG TPA: MFS transporter, partial [Sporolactobacillaceae bacterium]|nr:MFS transporter [Sporolactobacillaceae bacterium]
GILTLLAIANQTIAVIGPTLGGLLIDVGGWQSTFIINIPLSLACIVLGYMRFPKHSQDSNKMEGKREPIDLLGILFFGIMLLTALLFLMSPSLSKIYLLIIALIAGIIFTFLELKIKHPFIDLRVLGGNTPLLLTYARNVLSATVSYSILYGYTQWLEKGRELSPTQAGLLLLPMSLMAILVSRMTGKSPAIRLKLIVGSFIQFISMILLLFTSQSSLIVFLITIVLLLGIPQGLLNLANQNAVYFQALPEQIGASSGLLRTFMYFGAMIASSANGIFLKSDAMTPGIHHVAYFCGAISFILILITLLDRSLVKVGQKKPMTT